MKKCLTLGSISCQRPNSRQQWFVLSPTSPPSGDTAVRFKTRTSRWWFELASLWVHPPLVVLQINAYIWRWFRSLRAGATVLYGINRRNSHLCCLAASLLHEPFEYGEFLIAHFTLFNCVDKLLTFCLGIEIASFNSCKSDHKSAVNSS